MGQMRTDKEAAKEKRGERERGQARRCCVCEMKGRGRRKVGGKTEKDGGVKEEKTSTPGHASSMSMPQVIDFEYSNKVPFRGLGEADF